MRARNFLFLQGPPTMCFSRLAVEMRSRGHEVHAVNVNAGDALFWNGPVAANFRGKVDEWPDFVAALIGRLGTTDIVLFGDCRPMHVCAIHAAKAAGARVHVFELGYMRPGWVTLEEDGVNGHSSLPKDPGWYADVGSSLSPSVMSGIQEAGFASVGCRHVVYSAAMLLGRLHYPGYKYHRASHPALEALGWLRKWAVSGLQGRSESVRGDYFLFPLQLESDQQIRSHSPFVCVQNALAVAVRSFAAHAPSGALLFVKSHPLSNSPGHCRSQTMQEAKMHGVSHRVVFVDGGDILPMIKGARGVVTINSTAGLKALAVGTPVAALGKSIYALPGLTHQNGLDSFWSDPVAPDAVVFDGFMRVLARTSLVPGSFYGRDSIALLVQNAAARIEADMTPSRAVAEHYRLWQENRAAP